MKIINSGSKRSVLDIDDKLFLRFVSQDGAGEYPTVIFLLNRIFLRDYDRGGEHIGITMKIKAGDDLIWYKVPKEEVLDKFLEYFIAENEDENNDSPNTYTPSKSNVPLESFFKEESSLIPMATYFKSKDLYYINRDSELFVSTENPFDELALRTFFPEEDDFENNTHFVDDADNIIDVLSLNDDKDLVLTTTRLYRYDKPTDTFIKIVELPSGEATSMCKLTDYFIITSNAGIYIINNIESDDNLNYELVTSSSEDEFDNGLNMENNFTYSLPVADSNMVEVNGNDNKSCIFDCDSKMGQIGSKVNGRHSRYFNNEPMLFTDNYVYDNKNNVYKVANGAKFAICGDFIFFTMEDSASVVIFLKDSPNKNIVITLSDNLIDTYMDNFTIYLTDKDNKIYKSTVEEGNDANFYFIFFNYDEFSKKEENGESIKEIDIRTIQPNILTYLNMLKGDAGTNNSQVSDQYDQYYRDLFGGIDIEGVGFIFYITGDDNKRVWTLFGDDKRQDDVFTEMVEVFGIG